MLGFDKSQVKTEHILFISIHLTYSAFATQKYWKEEKKTKEKKR